MRLVGEEDLLPGLLSLKCQGGVLRHEGLPFLHISLEQPFLGALEGESQAVQAVQASAPAQADAEVFLDKLPHGFPVPVGHFDA